MDFKTFQRGYWDFYIELEERMIGSKKYVAFDEDNLNAFSSNYLMLFQSVCSEIDVVGKEIAAYFNSDFENCNGTKPINRWWFEIQNRLSSLNREVVFSGSIHVTPWVGFRVVRVESTRLVNGKEINVVNFNLEKGNHTPEWWTAYNKVKHERLKKADGVTNYKKANLRNLVNAFAALYLLEFDFMKEIGTLEQRIMCEPSVLFGMGDLDRHTISRFYTPSDIISDTDEIQSLVGLRGKVH